MKKIGFIGLGNMSSAIIKGLCESNTFHANQIFGYNRTFEKAQNMHVQCGIQVVETMDKLIESVDVLVLGVKPQNLDEILPFVNQYLRPEQIVISIAAGKPLSYYQTQLQSAQHIFRVMPNINAVVGASTSCYSTTSTDENNKQFVEALFTAVGTIVELPEAQFSTFTTIGCASPAFTYMYIDALARAGVMEGMKKELALKIAASSVLGSAKMILQSEEHPWALVDQVCSPGGTTIQGVAALQANQFEHAVHEAVKAVSARDAELNKK
jgi:pyrroline-5-carboxylate reductase